MIEFFYLSLRSGRGIKIPIFVNTEMFVIFILEMKPWVPWVTLKTTHGDGRVGEVGQGHLTFDDVCEKPIRLTCAERCA